MATLVSKNKEKTINLSVKAYALKDGGMLLIGKSCMYASSDSVWKWYLECGLYGIYFDPGRPIAKYSELSFEETPIQDDDIIVIKLS